MNTPQYFLKSCHRHAQPCQNTRSQERSWEVRTRWERIHLPAWGEGALSPTERVAPRPLTPAGRGLRDTPVWAGGWDALDAQSYPGAGYPALRWYQGCSTGRISTTKPPSPRSSSDGEAHPPSVASANNSVEHHTATAPWGSPISSRDTGTQLRSTNLSRAPGRWPPEPAFAGRAVFGGLSLLFFFFS